MFRFGVLYLCRGREARGFFESGVSIFNTPIQRIQAGETAPVIPRPIPVRSRHEGMDCASGDSAVFVADPSHLNGRRR